LVINASRRPSIYPSTWCWPESQPPDPGNRPPAVALFRRSPIVRP